MNACLVLALCSENGARALRAGGRRRVAPSLNRACTESFRAELCRLDGLAAIVELLDTQRAKSEQVLRFASVIVANSLESGALDCAARAPMPTTRASSHTSAQTASRSSSCTT